MPKTPDETKRMLITCTELNMPQEVQHRAMCDALALIQQYENTINNLAEANASVCKQRDALRLRVENREKSLKHLNDLRDAAAGRALQMEERVHQLEAERDAAVDALDELRLCNRCNSCKNNKDGHFVWPDEYGCSEYICKYEKRGVQKEE